ncbi:TOBE domain-containing protein, partial [Escherichia coli]
FISRFVGKTNLLPGRVTRCGAQAEVETGALRVLVDGAGLRHGDSVQLSLRPEKLVPVPAGQGKLSCVVSTRYFLGSQWMYGLDSPVGALTV